MNSYHQHNIMIDLNKLFFIGRSFVSHNLQTSVFQILEFYIKLYVLSFTILDSIPFLSNIDAATLALSPPLQFI